jgi:transcription elongation factor GreA
MTEKPTYLTAAGKQKLEAELQYLLNVRRPEVAKQIGDSKEGGDIMENAGYDEAKYQQAVVEGRIQTLEGLLANVEIIAESGSSGTVTLGSTVTVLEKGGSPETYHLVGSAESDPIEGRISDESPLGRVLIGHRAGERVVARSPDGPREFEILDVS